MLDSKEVDIHDILYHVYLPPYCPFNDNHDKIIETCVQSCTIDIIFEGVNFPLYLSQTFILS